MEPVRQVKTAPAQAEVVLHKQEAGPLTQALADAAGEAAARGGVLRVYGGTAPSVRPWGPH